MNHLVEQAPASDAMQVVRALRVLQEVREYFPREVLALLRRWLRHLNGPYRRLGASNPNATRICLDVARFAGVLEGWRCGGGSLSTRRWVGAVPVCAEPGRIRYRSAFRSERE